MKRFVCYQCNKIVNVDETIIYYEGWKTRAFCSEECYKERLKEAIDMADLTNNNKIKGILLRIAALPEDKQEAMLELTFMLAKAR
jgi:hypothetical protein